MPEMTPRAFSFNSPHGACPECQGLGATYDFDPRRVVPDESKSLAEGAIAPWAQGRPKLVQGGADVAGADFGIDLGAAVRAGCRRSIATCLLAREAARGSRRAEAGGKAKEPARSVRGQDFEGVIPNLRRRYEEGSLGGAGRARAVSHAASVPGLPRPAAEAAEPGGSVKGADVADYVEPADQRGAATCSTRSS